MSSVSPVGTVLQIIRNRSALKLKQGRPFNPSCRHTVHKVWLGLLRTSFRNLSISSSKIPGFSQSVQPSCCSSSLLLFGSSEFLPFLPFLPAVVVVAVTGSCWTKSILILDSTCWVGPFHRCLFKFLAFRSMGLDILAIGLITFAIFGDLG